MDRGVTSDGDRTTALASAGTLYLSLYQKVILTRSGCGSIFSTLPTGTPRMTTSSPLYMPVLLAKYPTTFVRPMPLATPTTVTMPPIRTSTRATATPIVAFRDFTVHHFQLAGPPASRWAPAG